MNPPSIPFSLESLRGFGIQLSFFKIKFCNQKGDEELLRSLAPGNRSIRKEKWFLLLHKAAALTEAIGMQRHSSEPLSSSPGRGVRQLADDGGGK